VPGFAFGTVLRFQLFQSITGACTLSLAAGALVDEAGNPNAGQGITFTFDSAPGAVLFASTNQSSTAALALTRSAIGSPLLFHGQFFDYDAGLYYMRARFYEPYSGLFLQLDPSGYSDSPNLYAGFANNPSSYRDPSGTFSLGGLFSAVGRFAGKAFRPFVGTLRRFEYAVDLAGHEARALSRVGGLGAVSTDLRAAIAASKATAKSGGAEVKVASRAARAETEQTAAGELVEATMQKPGPGRAKYRTKEMNPRFAGKDEHGNRIDTPENEDGLNPGVIYYDESDRKALLVTVKDGRLRDAKGELVDTSNSGPAMAPNGKAIYVMDESGNVYLHHKPGAGAVHHSSMLAGGNVAAGGEIEVEMGVIKSINRESGHYKPELEHLDQFLSELKERGVNVDSINVIREIREK
jgi:RHS repeat-associated protein